VLFDQNTSLIFFILPQTLLKPLLHATLSYLTFPKLLIQFKSVTHEEFALIPIILAQYLSLLYQLLF
jgi:hypothetical protein